MRMLILFFPKRIFKRYKINPEGRYKELLKKIFDKMPTTCQGLFPGPFNLRVWKTTSLTVVRMTKTIAVSDPHHQDKKGSTEAPQLGTLMMHLKWVTECLQACHSRLLPKHIRAWDTGSGWQRRKIIPWCRFWSIWYWQKMSPAQWQRLPLTSSLCNWFSANKAETPVINQ